MTWQALVPIRPWVKDVAGACLRYAQSFFGAPAMHRSAWHAWQAQQHRHSVWDQLPGVPVLLWFSHFGTYNDGRGQYGTDPSNPYYCNWGHVAVMVPGEGIYTSPGAGYGSERWDTIAQIESRFASRYVGWSEDINGLRVAQPGSGGSAPSIGDDDMTPEQANQLSATYQAIFGPANANGSQVSWKNVDGTIQTAQYGLLPIVIHNQTLIAALSGQVAALAKAVTQVGGGGTIDMAAITKAAEKGAKDALAGLTLKAQG